MTPREKAIEAMARAAHDVDWREGHYDQLPNDAPMKAYSRQCATAALDALLAELPGMGLLPPMPHESTTEMEDAAGDVPHEWNSGEVWAAMCAAAPNVLEGEKT